jgi:hypothetical protein
MLEFGNWQNYYRDATRKDLVGVRYDTWGGTPFHVPGHKDIKPVIAQLREISKADPSRIPTTVLSLGEGHFPCNWVAQEAQAYAGFMDRDFVAAGGSTSLVCVDPMLGNPYAREIYVEEYARTFSTKFLPFYGDLPVVATGTATRDGMTAYSFNQAKVNVNLHLLDAGLPAGQPQTERIRQLTGDGSLWLNIQQLLNYMDWNEFKDYALQFLAQTTIVSFSNKVDADRDLWDWMNKGRLRQNTLFFDWMVENNFKPIWQFPLLDTEIPQDVGAVFVKTPKAA